MPILLLDEPTTGLDETSREEIWRAIEALRGAQTILVVTHRADEAKRCDAVLNISEGTIRSESPSESTEVREGTRRALLG